MSSSKEHIVIVSSEFPPQPGGIGNHAYHLALALNKSGFQVTVITDQRSENGDIENEFDKLLPFTVNRIKISRIRFFMYLSRLFKIFILLKKANCVIATGKFSLWSVAFLNVVFSKKCLAIIHGSEVNYKSFLLKKSINIALKKFDKIIAVSNFTKNLITYLGREVIVIPNGILLKEWYKERGISKSVLGKPAIVTVGRISKRKGQARVIEMLPEVLKHFPELHYHCVGIAKEASEINKFVTEFGLSNHVTIHGELNFIELKQILSSVDIFVMLSQETQDGDVEGFGIAILEANALGLPAIGSKNCGIEDAINNYSSGILIDSTNSRAFVEAINIILEERARYSKMALKWAYKHSWDNLIHRYISVIEN